MREKLFLKFLLLTKVSLLALISQTNFTDGAELNENVSLQNILMPENPSPIHAVTSSLKFSSKNISSNDGDPCLSVRKTLRGYGNIEIKRLLIERTSSEKEACTLMFICNLETFEEETCPILVDGIGTCFFSTPSGMTATASCPGSMEGIPYDENKNVTRECKSGGKWTDKSNYTECLPILDVGLLMCVGLDDYFGTGGQNRVPDNHGDIQQKPCKFHLHNLAIIVYVGRGLSLITLILAFVLFWILRSIRCWRNIIHWNLATSFILRNVFWILLHLFINHHSRQQNTISCRVLVTIFNYTQATNYFWMFVEGLYLHMMIVLAYTHERIKLEVYLAIGWGVPVPLTLLWSLLKSKYEDRTCWMPDTNESKMADYFIQIPIIIILLVNAVILGNIVRILFTKLSAGYASGGTTSEAAQYTKAVKAALFLFPLLGGIYVIFFISPSSDTAGKIVFLYFNTFLQSFQGTFVCIIYCFANSEIQRALLKKLDSWRWQSGCLCCLRRDDNPNLNRRVSSMSLSRTNNTFLSLKGRDCSSMRDLPTLSNNANAWIATSSLTSPSFGRTPVTHLATTSQQQDRNEKDNECSSSQESAPLFIGDENGRQNEGAIWEPTTNF